MPVEAPLLWVVINGSIHVIQSVDCNTSLVVGLLKRGKTKTIRIIAFYGALTVFFYMVAVALTRIANPFAW